MLLRKLFAGIPAGLFACICALFLLNQRYGSDLIRLDYNLCHLLFGFAFPLVLGYMAIPPKTIEHVPFRVFIAQVRATPIQHWPGVIFQSVQRDFETGIPWSPLAGAFWTLFFSILNEVFIDPATNEIPFTSAYENFVTDVLGIGLFLLVCHLVIGSFTPLSLKLTAQT